ncbi:MAG: 7TM diverse intracellular signaling domain-containing protein [Runella sp.]
MKIVYILLLLFSYIVGYTLPLNKQILEHESVQVTAFEYLIDQNHKIPINQLLSNPSNLSFVSYRKPILNLGYSQDRVWVKYEVFNKSDNDKWFLTIDNSRLNFVKLYLVVNGQVVHQETAGDYLPASTIPFFPSPTFALVLQPNTPYSIILQIESTEDLKFSFVFRTFADFARYTSERSLLWGIYFGFILLISFFNLFLWWLNREKIFFNYALYVLFFGLFQASLYGYGYRFFWGNSIFNDRSHIIFIGLLTIFFTYFSIDFLGVFKYYKRHKMLFSIVAWSWVLFLLWVIFTYNYYTNIIVIALGALMILLQQFYALRLYFVHRQSSALTYLLATLCLSVSILIVGAMNLGWLTYLNQDYLIMSGSVIEILIFSFSISDRLRRTQLEKEKLMQVRQEISANLHDDLAASLSGLTLYLEFQRLKKQNFTQEGLEILQSAIKQVRQIMDLVRSTVWEINPQNDFSEEWVLQLKNLVKMTLQSQNIDYNLMIDPSLEEYILPIDLRRHLMLLLKEVLTNIVKHAKASEVTIECTIENQKSLVLCIQDNGCGFDLERTRKGNGMNTLHQRAQALKSKLLISSSEGNGTRVLLHTNLSEIATKYSHFQHS